MRFILLLVMLVLTGTAQGTDINPTRNEEQMQVRLHLSATAKSVREKCAALGIQLGSEGGCAVTDTVAKTCDIYVAEPHDVFDERMGILGHEVYHCFKGRYHEAPQ